MKMPEAAKTIRRIGPVLSAQAVFWAVLLGWGCAGKKDAGDPVILARVGDRTITVNEFVERAEYTIRPRYCRGDGYIHRKIVLNSLIAEKMLALEAGEDNALAGNESFQQYLRGRREQAMRQVMYARDFVKPVKLDTADINSEFRVSGRTVRLSYFTVKDSSLGAQVRRAMENGLPFDSAFQDLGGISMPKREVGWESPESRAVHEALFRNPLSKGQVLPPVTGDDGSLMFLRVDGWNDRLSLSETDQRRRRNDVIERLTQERAGEGYRKYIGRLMKGRTVQFERDTFFALVNAVAPRYLHEDSTADRSIIGQVLDDNRRTLSDSVGSVPEDLKDRPLFRYDGKIWTVGDLEKEVMSHPLVFRKNRIKNSEFGEQFKLAVVDLLQDRAVTEQAYKKRYDRAGVVERTEVMWRDNLMALYEKYRILKTLGRDTGNGTAAADVTGVLEPFFAALRKKYDPAIRINTDAFEAIRLTSIDMLAQQKNAPYPVVVPNFPELTTHSALDYGRKLDPKDRLF